MKPWIERPRVEATLLNPALMAAILAASAHGYESKRSKPMVWPLVFLVPPLVLHGPTRKLLPKTVATHMPTWLGRHPLVRASFPARASRLTPLTQEGLRFGLARDIVVLDGGRLKGSAPGSGGTGELAEILKSASLVGRWLAKLDQPSSAFVLLGVRP